METILLVEDSKFLRVATERILTRAGYQVIYDGRVEIIHLKGTSVAKDYGAMSRAIFEAATTRP